MVEKIELTNMCMIYDDKGNVLVQHRIKSWKGWTFPGGHVEAHESFVDSTIREIKEETNLDISNLKLVALKQWENDNVRHVVILYKTNRYSGELISSDEGEMKWVNIDELYQMELPNTFKEMLDLYQDDSKNEMILSKKNNTNEWNIITK